ncbi:hypothetical protein AVEN_58470-1 [Araneus ventricosus]|uniref:Uncharacterized protein n=1 Tax=Araneus ventricosus TaxID=182803 RepID=A0A4Y2UST6_ARAVE|nr:hypothetical protein AVEN_58470-1 [Araneus ventricosus]
MSKVILQRRSHSKDVPYRILPPSIYSVPDRAWRHMEISGEIRISAPNRDIEKINEFSGIFDLSPKLLNRQGEGFRSGRCRSFHTYPCKTFFPNIRQTLAESDISCS